MRWTRKQFRVLKRFAFLPIEIDEEFRWFEWVYIQQIYNPYSSNASILGWVTKKFVSRHEYLSFKKEKKDG